MVISVQRRGVHRRALAALVVFGLGAGSLIGVAGAASADTAPLTVSISGGTSLGGTLTAITSRDDSSTLHYAWTVSPVDTDEQPLVSTEPSYVPIASHKNQTIKVTVTDSSDSATATSAGVLITGGNVQTGQPSVAAGESFGVGGTLFLPGASYLIQFDSTVVTTLTAAADGSFSTTIPVPLATTRVTHTISVQSATPGVGKITSTTILVTAPPSNPTTSATTPHISGTVKVGIGIEVVLGSWTPGTVFTYQWQRDGHSIKGEISPRYGVQPTDKGHLLRIRVIGTSDAATVTAYSESARVKAATFTSTPRITIKGTLKRGHKLRAVVTGGFSPAATTHFAWYVNGVKVAGTTSTIIVKRTWKHKRVTVHLTGSRLGYTTVTRSYTTVKKVAK